MAAAGEALGSVTGGVGSMGLFLYKEGLAGLTVARRLRSCTWPWVCSLSAAVLSSDPRCS